MLAVRRFVLGSAAALVAMAGAKAADLPLRAKAVEYVKVCSLYGAGFYYIPGTDTCLKLGGYLRVDVLANTNSDDTGNVSGQGGAKNRYTNGYLWRSREDIDIDTRTQTEFGVLRTFAFVTLTWNTDSYLGTGTGATIYSPIGSGGAGASAPNNANQGAVAGGWFCTCSAFIQFAGFTVGRAISQFSMPWVNYPGNTFDGLVGGGGTITGVNQFTYTWDLGQGRTFAVSVQDQVAYYQAGVQNLGTFGVTSPAGGALGPFGGSDYAGSSWPDFVARFRADQSWGIFQLSVAAHDNHAAYYGTGGSGGVEPFGHPGDLWGYATAAGLTIRNIPTGAADTINIQGVYTNGATRYNIQDLATQYGAVGLFGNSGNPLAYQSVAINAAPDTVFVTGGNQHPIQTWGAQGGYNHNWNPHWVSSPYGAWASVSYDSFSKLAICGTAGNGASSGGTFLPVFSSTKVAGGGTCNPDYQIVQAGLITRWTPVKGLTFSADVTWSHIAQNNAGLILAASPTVGKPVAYYELKNQNNTALLLRAQRNW